MADVKISDLPALGRALADTDVFAVDTGTATRKVAFEDLIGDVHLVEKNITANGTYLPENDNADGYSKVVANVPNAYAAGDEGKVVVGGVLVAQTARTVTSNDTYDTTTNDSVTVNVPNTYGAGDNGKVIVNLELVTQTERTIDENGTFDTLTNNRVIVNVSGGSGDYEYAGTTDTITHEHSPRSAPTATLNEAIFETEYQLMGVA